MKLKIYEGKEATRSHLSLPLMVMNTGFATAVVFWWAIVALLLADPINWAAARHMNARPELFDYPFIMVWGMPIVAVIGGWIADQFKVFKLSLAMLAFPICYFGMILSVFYFAPIDWK